MTKRGRPKKEELKKFYFEALFEAIVGFEIEAKDLESAIRKIKRLEKKEQIDFSSEHGIETTGDNLGAFLSVDLGSVIQESSNSKKIRKIDLFQQRN